MSLSGTFKAVLFDLGGTLIKTVEVAEVYRAILKAHGVEASLNEIAKAHGESEKESDFYDEMVRWKEGFWVRWNSRVLEKIGIEDNREYLARKIDELWWDYAQVEVYPDVIDTLTRLKSGNVKVGVITNAFEKDYQQILQKLALTQYFDVVIGVDACNRAKPDPAIFLHAVHKLGVRPEEVIFVGDSIKRDYEGARRAGLKPLLIDRSGRNVTNFETITTLTELLKYV